MRSRMVKILNTERVLTLQRAVEMLSDAAVQNRDNPHVPEEIRFIPTQTRDRIRAWEEAPLLDEIAVNAGYRGTLVNLGLALRRLRPARRVRAGPAAANWLRRWASGWSSSSISAGRCSTRSAPVAACRARCCGITRPTWSAPSTSSRPNGNAA